MHELGIVFHAIDQLERLAVEKGLTEIASVTMEFGEVSGVIPHEIEACWNWSVKKRSTHLLSAKLHIETIPAVTFCSTCQKEYPTVEHGRTCPFCNSADTYLVQGNEINIKEVVAR